MTSSHKILRRFVMPLSAAAALFYFFVAYLGFSLAKAFQAQWLFTNWSGDAVNAIPGILFTVTLMGIGFRSWAISKEATLNIAEVGAWT